jgi:hypothetical protein
MEKIEMANGKILEWLKDMRTKSGLKEGIRQLFKIQNDRFKKSGSLSSFEAVVCTK